MTVTRQPSWSGRHADAADLLVSAAFGLVVGVGTIAQRGTDPDAVLAAISLGAAVGLAVLWSLRRRRGRAEQEARARLEQRLEIARELHDVVAHHVSVIGIQAAAARRTLGGPPDATTTALAAIEASSRAAVQEMQHLVITLRRDDDPAHTGATAAETAPAPGLRDLPDLFRNTTSAGLRVEATGFVDARLAAVPASIQVALYRVTQEALTNALRHGGSTVVAVAIRVEPGRMTLSVDDGPGSSARPGAAPGGGLGIPGMVERMRAVGGTLTAGPAADGGYSVVASVPVDLPSEPAVAGR